VNTLFDEVVEGGTLCACKIFEIQFGAHIADHFLPYTDTVKIEAALHKTA